MAIDRKIREAAALGRRLQQVFVATAGRQGLPHMAAAGEIGYLSARRVVLSCNGRQFAGQSQGIPGVWDPRADKGY